MGSNLSLSQCIPHASRNISIGIAVVLCNIMRHAWMSKCDREKLLYPVSALQVMILPSYHMLGAQSPLKGNGTSEDNLLRMTQMHWVHPSSLYTRSNEWQLSNNNLLIHLKLRGTCPGGECLPTRPLCWSLENAMRSLPYHGLEGTLQKRGLSPFLFPTNIPFAS